MHEHVVHEKLTQDGSVGHADPPPSCRARPQPAPLGYTQTSELDLQNALPHANWTPMPALPDPEELPDPDPALPDPEPDELPEPEPVPESEPVSTGPGAGLAQRATEARSENARAASSGRWIMAGKNRNLVTPGRPARRVRAEGHPRPGWSERESP
jgi:hypothetical protein